MIPMYIFYSMFGFQRIGDFIWAAGDMQARGFLLGATAGRTTLAGEGLQHQDGHSHLLASTIPNCVAYDPCFSYELAVIMQDGLRRMFVAQEKRLLLHQLHERELRPPADAERRRAGNPARHVPAAHRRPRRSARDAAGLRHHPARGARRGGAARVGVRHPGGRVQRHELLGVAPRRARRRARGDAEAGRKAAPALGARVPGGPAGSVHRRDRLHEDRRRPDPAVGARPLRRAGDRRLRPQRFAPGVAQPLRGGPALDSWSRR